MIAKLVIASVLVASSVSGSALENLRGADGSTAQWPHMHQCTLDAVSNFTVTNTGGVATGTLRVAGEITVSRIDLRVTGAPGGSPTITAYAINTKGTGANSGRSGVTNQNPIGVDCVKSEVTGNAAAQKAAASAFAFMSADGKSVGWSCSVSGTEDNPVFSVALLVPTILGQAQPTVVDRSASWSWGVSNSRVSIVPRSAENSDSWHVACSSKEPRNTNYDLAVLKKA